MVLSIYITAFANLKAVSVRAGSLHYCWAICLKSRNTSIAGFYGQHCFWLQLHATFQKRFNSILFNLFWLEKIIFKYIETLRGNEKRFQRNIFFTCSPLYTASARTFFTLEETKWSNSAKNSHGLLNASFKIVLERSEHPNNFLSVLYSNSIWTAVKNL